MFDGDLCLATDIFIDSSSSGEGKLGKDLRPLCDSLFEVDGVPSGFCPLR